MPKYSFDAVNDKGAKSINCNSLFKEGMYVDNSVRGVATTALLVGVVETEVGKGGSAVVAATTETFSAVVGEVGVVGEVDVVGEVGVVVVVAAVVVVAVVASSVFVASAVLDIGT